MSRKICIFAYCTLFSANFFPFSNKTPIFVYMKSIGYDGISKGDGPLVSFIITYFNLPIEMLRECMDSIMALSLSEKEREIILVDDGSSDSPLDGLADYRDHILYIRQRNSGLSAARNIGVEISNGRYIQFVDGDDALIQPAYEHCLDIIRYDDTADVVLFESSAEVLSQVVFTNSPAVSGAVYMHNNNLHASAWGYIFKRSVLGGLRFTPGILHEDEEFTPQLLLRAECVISTDAVAYWYRKREVSIINNKDMRHRLRRLNDKEQVIFRLNELADRIPRNERIALQRRVHQLTMDYIYNIITLTHSERQLERRIRRLKRKALFPLPEKKYTTKYRLFGMMTRYKLTRRILLSVMGK